MKKENFKERKFGKKNCWKKIKKKKNFGRKC